MESESLVWEGCQRVKIADLRLELDNKISAGLKRDKLVDWI